MERLLVGILILVIPGIFVISFGFRALSGRYKDFYIVTHIFSGRIYASIPWGIMALWWAAAAIPQSKTWSWVLFYIGVGFFVLGGIFYIFQPSFLKPAWLKWLEREHGDILPILQHEAQAMGLKVWEKRVETQEGLEEWVAEVRRKHGRNHTT